MTPIKARFLVRIVPVVLLLFLSSKSSIFAQSQSLSIYPPVIEVQTVAPSSPTAPIVIQNNNSEDVNLKIQLIPIKQNGLSGEVTLHPELTNSGFYPYYKDKIQFLVEGKKTDSISLQALETKEVLVNINLEKGDPPGDYYYSVVFISEGNQPKESSVSRIPTGIATNLLLSIGPKDKSTGGIVEFSTSSFKSNGPVEFNLLLHNASRHLIEPNGYIEVSDLFGRKIGKIDILPQFILAGGDRYLIDEKQATGEARLAYNESDNKPKIVWPEKFLMGIYKAKANIILEENGRKVEAETYFFAFPTYLFFGLALIIFISLSVYLRVRKKI